MREGLSHLIAVCAYSTALLSRRCLLVMRIYRNSASGKSLLWEGQIDRASTTDVARCCEPGIFAQIVAAPGFLVTMRPDPELRPSNSFSHVNSIRHLRSSVRMV